MIVLALDLATTLGWALFDRETGELRSGWHKLKAQTKGKTDRGRRIRDLEDWLPLVLREVAWGKGEVVYEEEALHTYPMALAVASQLQAVLLSSCATFGVEHVSSINPTTLKSFATGNGNAPKELVLDAVRERWASDVQEHNEADAVALLYCHLEAS